MKAVTQEGQHVILHADGRWEYLHDKAGSLSGRKDFRNANWGDSKATVKANETAQPLDEQPEALWYSGMAAGYSCTILYVFAENQLVRTKYIINDTYTNLNRYLNTFFGLKDNLSKKYGEPIKDHVNWLDDLYQDDEQQWGFAISLGHLNCYTEWSAGKSIVNVAISGENHEIMVSIEYLSRELIHLEQERIEQATLADL